MAPRTDSVTMRDLVLRLSTRPTRLMRTFARDGVETLVRHPRRTDLEKQRRKLYVVVSGPALFMKQCQRAERFLKAYQELLRAYLVEDGHRAMLDFGVPTERIEFVKNVFFPAEFAALLASIGINLNVSVYSPSWE